MKKSIKEVMIDVASNTLTEKGYETLKQLESLYNPEYSRIRKEYPYYSDVEKLDYLINRNDREKRISLVPSLAKDISIDPISFLSTHSDIDWLSIDLDKIQEVEKTFKSYLEEIAVAKELILTERIEKELSSLMEQRSDLDSKILELQTAKANIFGEAV